VGPGGTYAKPCAAIAAAQAGDTIQIDAGGNGTYDGDVCQWTTGGLTIEGVNGRAHIDAAGQAAVGKGIWVIDGAGTTIRNVELSGATNVDGNGAGIRAEGAGLTVTGSVFANNQDGILANDNASSDIVVESSEFDHNGAGDDQTHNIYIGDVRSFVLRFSYSHDAVGGDLVKSRADSNDILYNRLTGEGGSSAYELDLPNGGPARVIGNSIQQGPATAKPALLAYGEESPLHANSQLSMVNNTFVDDRGTGSDTAVLVGGAVTGPALAQNNILAGATTFVSQGSATLTTNCTAADPMFVSRATLDYHLQPGSPCLGVGTRPADALVPTMQYVHPLGSAARTDAGAAAGAFSNEPVVGPASEPPATLPAENPPAPTPTSGATGLRVTTVKVADGSISLAVPRSCVTRGRRFHVKFSFKRSHRRHAIFIKVSRVIFSVGDRRVKVDRTAPFSATLTLKPKAGHTSVTVRARATIKLRHRKARTKSVSAKVFVC
jgi:hypothetical protein